MFVNLLTAWWCIHTALRTYILLQRAWMPRQISARPRPMTCARRRSMLHWLYTIQHFDDEVNIGSNTMPIQCHIHFSSSHTHVHVCYTLDLGKKPCPRTGTFNIIDYKAHNITPNYCDAHNLNMCHCCTTANALLLNRRTCLTSGKRNMCSRPTT